jgi:hypothetical protein
LFFSSSFPFYHSEEGQILRTKSLATPEKATKSNTWFKNNINEESINREAKQEKTTRKFKATLLT